MHRRRTMKGLAPQTPSQEHRSSSPRSALSISGMKTASRARPRSPSPRPRPPRSPSPGPQLVQMRRYRPGVGVYPFLFPSVISALPLANRSGSPPAPRLLVQQASSSVNTPSPAGTPVDPLLSIKVTPYTKLSCSLSHAEPDTKTASTRARRDPDTKPPAAQAAGTPRQDTKPPPRERRDPDTKPPSRERQGPRPENPPARASAGDTTTKPAARERMYPDPKPSRSQAHGPPRQ
nr:serine/arginine repetitive matrix protein 1-like [Oncorhynchus nerka]